MKKISQHPVLMKRDLAFVRGRRNSTISSVIDKGIIFSSLNARSALEIGIESLSLNRGDEVLIPAYHCPVMVHPVVNCGCTPVFYKINPDCTVNLDHLIKKITKKTRAILVVYYFGFPNLISQVKNICREKNFYLIEDCAHAFFGYCDGLPIGSFGDFSISSLWKFFPVYHGGFLRYENKELARRIRTIRPTIFLQVKSAVNTLEKSTDYLNNNSKRMLNFIFRVKDRLFGKIKATEEGSNSIEKAETVYENPFAYNLIADTYTKMKMPLFSTVIYNMTDKEWVVNRRRKNYEYLLNNLNKIPSVRPLFDVLPDGVVPYFFPILSDSADLLAEALRKNGVDILRFGEYFWEGMNENKCEVSSHLSKNCLQLPVHQSLNVEDMQYMLKVLSKTKIKIENKRITDTI